MFDNCATRPPPVRHAVIVPSRNEAHANDQLLDRLASLAEEDSALESVVIVDDGSSDHEGLRRRTVAGSYSWCRVRRHTQPLGQTAAIRTGWELTETDIVVIVDGDNEYDVRDAPRLVDELISTGADVVVGRRMNRSAGLSPSKSAFAWLLNQTLPLITGLRISDSGCGFKAVGDPSLISMMSMRDDHRYFPHLAHLARAKVVEVPVEWTPRPNDESHYGIERFFVLPIDLLRIALQKWTGERFSRGQMARFLIGLCVTAGLAHTVTSRLARRLHLT